MSGMDDQLAESVRSWLGEGPGARRLALADRGGAGVLYAPGVAEVPGLRSAGEATVVVLDAALPIGSDELAMLAQVPAPPAAVVFALSGPQTAGVTARNRELLAAFAPGFEASAMVPVGELEPLAEAVAAADRRMRGRDRRAEVAASAVEFEAARQQRKLAELARDPEFDALRARRAEMLRSRPGGPDQGGGLPAQLSGLRTAFGLAKVDLGHEIAARCRQASTAVRAELDAATKSELRGFPDRLRDELAGLGERLDQGIAARLRSVAPGLPAARGEPADLGPDEPRGRALAFEDQLMIVMGASGGLGLGRLLTTPLQLAGLSEVLSISIMLVLGAGLGWWIVRARANVGARQRMRQWAGDAIAEFKARWERILAQRGLDAEAFAVGSLGEEHARAVHEANRQLGALEERLAQVARGREGRARAINSRLAQAARLQAALAPHVSFAYNSTLNREGTNHVDAG